MFAEDSIRAVSREMMEFGTMAVPIVENSRFVGAVGHREIAFALSQGLDFDSPVSQILNQNSPTILSMTSGREALRRLQSEAEGYLVVLDSEQIPVGVLHPSCLVEHRGTKQHLGRVGGMATPFGVYLTNGATSGGAPAWAMVWTGILMFSIFAFVGTFVTGFSNMVPPQLQILPTFQVAIPLLWMGLFFFIFRFLPIAGTHGAEHMVVHAIERGEELKLDVVRRMPRVHPRCGTNLAVGATIFLNIMAWPLIRDQELRLLLAFLVTILIWQPLGNFIQFWVTTKPPTDRQIEDGIRAGLDLLNKVAHSDVSKPTVPRRLLASGMVQVFIGAILVQLLLSLVYSVLKIPIAWRVI